ncbi:MAG: hypothetical protein EOL88_15640 [Bacteroidia bacterium]|nr:hypothetical protein [Clostridia bacterium]NCD43502.1 hypothetical protein [Bacteroidia bacterium]
MRTYISDIIPRIQKFSQKLDNLTLLTNQHWVVIDDIDKTKNVYIFRQNNELLISQNGKVEKAKWEYLGHNSLLIDRKEESYLFKHGFFDENILALKIDSKEEYAFLVNETKFDKELNSSINVIEFLNKKYIESSVKRSIQDQTGLSIDSYIDSNTIEIYQPPNHTIRKITERNPLFGTMTEQYLVEFEDGQKGEVFLENKDKTAYFKAKINGMWVKSKIFYSNIDLCIIALHKYLKTGEIYEVGFIGAYE